MQEIIQNRYVVGEVVGIGAMGTVHRALDRLTGQSVALKRLTTRAGDIRFATRILESEKSATEVRLTMAREFQALATLRHPSIITVLDYGFEENGQPFFTMELLAGAKNILEAGQNQPLDLQIRLLVQMLEALAYLHRRGILHRDLKPDNVMVGNDGVRLLDFGLAANVDSNVQGIAGTLAYIAPEVLDGEAPGYHSDLYSVGVIAYEMMIGRHPFRLGTAAALIEDILDTVPDPLAAGLPEPIAQVLSRLLAKTPAARYPDADSVAVALCRATGFPLPAETSAIREGFLQSARFVGRSKEIDTLMRAMRDARKGQGSAHLILGESGVGKTRLVGELAIRAVVEDVITLRVQCKPEGGPLLAEWRLIFRHLGLLMPESDEIAEAIAILTGEATAEAIGTDQRIGAAISLFRTLQRPVLLLLEDIQWATDDLELARLLCREAMGLPLMLVATVRLEDASGVVERLKGASHLRLERFRPDEIAELSYNMIGPASRKPQVQALLQRQTEGNAYFLVEVVRVLAEEAGSLINIGTVTLPEAVFAEGVRSVIRRRLERLLPEDRALLWIAAVFGRVLDLTVLRTVAESMGHEVGFDEWLTRCADAAVVELANNVWQFTHDTLRDTVLADIPAPDRVHLHRQVAETMEQLYGADPAHSRELAYHWRAAGDESRERRYALQVARAATAADSYQEAIGLLERAVYLTAPDDTENQMFISLEFGHVYTELGDYLSATVHLERAAQLAEQLGNQIIVARALLLLGDIAVRQGQGGIGRRLLEQALSINSPLDDPITRTRVHGVLAALSVSENELEEAEKQFNAGLGIARTAGLQMLEATLLTQLGALHGRRGDYEDGLNLWRQTLTLPQQSTSMAQEATLLATMGLTAWLRGDAEPAREYTEGALNLERQLGRRYNIATCLITLGHIYTQERQFAEATSAFQRALVTLSDFEMPGQVLDVLSGLALLYITFGQYVPAAELLGLIMNHGATSRETYENCATMWARLRQETIAEAEPLENMRLLEGAYNDGRRTELHHVVQRLIQRLRPTHSG